MSRPVGARPGRPGSIERLLLRLDAGSIAFSLGVAAVLFGVAILINPLTFMYGSIWDSLSQIAGPLVWGSAGLGLGLGLLLVRHDPSRSRLLLLSVIYWSWVAASFYVAGYGVPPIAIAPVVGNALSSAAAYWRAKAWPG